MAAATSVPFASYSDYCRSFQLTKARCESSVRSLVSLHRGNDKGSLRVARQSTIVCARQPKSATVTFKSWDNLVLQSESPVLVEFYASWCGPCQMVHRVIDEIASDYKGKLDCYVLNTDNDLDIAEEYEVKAVPVVMLFKNGKKHGCIAGTMPKEFYVAAIEKVLAS